MPNMTSMIPYGIKASNGTAIAEESCAGVFEKVACCECRELATDNYPHMLRGTGAHRSRGEDAGSVVDFLRSSCRIQSTSLRNGSATDVWFDGH